MTKQQPKFPEEKSSNGKNIIIESLNEETTRYTVVVFTSYLGPDSDPPSHSCQWKIEPFEDYGDACVEAKQKAFEFISPGCTLRAYREGEELTGVQGEFEVLYRIDHEETSVRVCITQVYGDADFRERKG